MAEVGRHRAARLIRELNVPIGEVDEMFPRVVTRLAELEMEHGAPLGPLRLVEEFHAGFGGGPVALAAVARHAGADDVFPRGFAAPVARDDMVEIEVLAVEFVAAILAGVVVALEDVVAREFHFLLRHPVEEEEQNHLGNADGERDGADHIAAFVAAREAEPLVEGHGLERAAIGLDHLCVALVEQHEGALDAADVYRLPETIEHEDVVAQDRFHGFLNFERPKALDKLDRL